MRKALFLLALLLLPSLAHAQEGEPDDLPPVRARPTSGEASLHSGRTLGVGETAIAGAAGWPGIWAHVELALTSSFNLGIRAGLLYGSPLMSLEPGVGGELSLPMRIHLFGEGDIDIAAFVNPAFTAGEAATVGEANTTLRGVFGWSSRLEFGGLLGFHVAERLTFLVGAGGMAGFVHTPDAGRVGAIGGVLARAGIEGLISRDTMLFAVADGGVGFADDGGAGFPLFSPGLADVMLKLSLGIAYVL